MSLMKRIGVMVLIGLALACGPAPAMADEPDSPWTRIGPTGGSLGGATVYVPARKQVLGWGGLKSGNEVRAFDPATSQWQADYPPDKANVGGNFYGGQDYAAWLAGPDRPGPFFVFRLACWDSKRSRLILVMHNVTAAYDPAARTWTNLNAAFDAAGQRKAGTTQPAYDRAWFAPVPGQWGSCAYDPVNDQVVLFPLWLTRTSHWKLTEPFGPERADDAGVRAGHYGTMIFDCGTNTWTTPRLGPAEILAARDLLADLIDAQRRAAEMTFAAVVAARSGNKAEAARLMAAAALGQTDQQAPPVRAGTTPDSRSGLVNPIAALEKLAGSLTSYQAGQVKDAVKNLAPLLQRAGKVQADLAAGRLDDLPALSARQQAIYRLLRLVRDEDLYVQPIPRCSTSIVFDSRNKVMVMAGGNHLDRLLADTWVYDCRARLWQRKAAAPEPANWPAMCFDSKRGWVVYATEKASYAYDAAKDQWLKIGPGRPKGVYCDAAYDPERDVYVVNVSANKYGADETTWQFRPPDAGESVTGEPAGREEVDETPFPPSADPAVAERLRSMPANTWVRARPSREPTHRSWSTMSYDPALRAVIYQGGGHAGTMDNTVSAYFAESNTWVNAFRPHYPPPIFGSWSCAAGMLGFERGVTLSFHARWYESYAGQMVYGGQAGFSWATRERPIAPPLHSVSANGRFCLHPAKPLLIGCPPGRDSGDPLDPRKLLIFDVTTGRLDEHPVAGPYPKLNTEWSGLAVHPDRNVLVLHGAGDSQKKEGNQTWLLDLNDPKQWQQVELASTTPTVGMAKLSAIAGTDYLVCAMPASNDLWVFSFKHKAWKPLGVDDGDDKLPAGRRRFDLYGQCVWDPHNGVLVMVGLRGGYETRFTFLLRPDFDKIQW